MRVLSLLLVVAACGSVKTAPSVADAGSLDAPADAPGPCPIEIMNPAPPAWLTHGPFVLAVDPAGSGELVWVSNGQIPASASFSVPFRVGDQITGLVFTAYGSGGAGGLRNARVIYQPDEMSSWQILGASDDLGRKAQWGQDEVKLRPTVLDVGAICWVQFDITEPGYAIGMVTPILERPCPSK